MQQSWRVFWSFSLLAQYININAPTIILILTKRCATAAYILVRLRVFSLGEHVKVLGCVVGKKWHKCRSDLWATHIIFTKSFSLQKHSVQPVQIISAYYTSPTTVLARLLAFLGGRANPFEEGNIAFETHRIVSCSQNMSGFQQRDQNTSHHLFSVWLWLSITWSRNHWFVLVLGNQKSIGELKPTTGSTNLLNYHCHKVHLRD